MLLGIGERADKLGGSLELNLGFFKPHQSIDKIGVISACQRIVRRARAAAYDIARRAFKIPAGGMQSGQRTVEG